MEPDIDYVNLRKNLGSFSSGGTTVVVLVKMQLAIVCTNVTKDFPLVTSEPSLNI